MLTMTAVRNVHVLVIIAFVVIGFVAILFNRSANKPDMSLLQRFAEQRNNLSRQLNLLQVREYLKYVNHRSTKHGMTS